MEIGIEINIEMGIKPMFNPLINQKVEFIIFTTESNSNAIISMLYIPFALIITVIIIMAIFYILKEMALKKIRMIIQDYARQRGFRYVGDISSNIRPLLGGTPLLDGETWAEYGVRHYINNKVVTTCTWYSLIDQGKHSEQTIYQLAIIPVNFKRDGFIFMRRERLGDKLANLFGINDLDFEDKEFSDKYYIHADQKKFGYDLFHPRMMELFLNKRRYYVIVALDHVIIYLATNHESGFFQVRRYPEEILQEILWMEATRNMALEVERLIPGFMRYDT